MYSGGSGYASVADRCGNVQDRVCAEQAAWARRDAGEEMGAGDLPGGGAGPGDGDGDGVGGVGWWRCWLSMSQGRRASTWPSGRRSSATGRAGCGATGGVGRPGRSPLS